MMMMLIVYGKIDFVTREKVCNVRGQSIMTVLADDDDNDHKRR